MIQKIFSMDNSFMRALARITDIIILNVLFLVCSIPLVTFGASLAALYSMTLKMVRNEEPYIIRGFFEAFQKNFRQGTLFGLLSVAAAGVIAADLFILGGQRGSVAELMRTLCIAVGIVLSIIFLYVFPITARFEMKAKAILKNALLISIAHLPQTVLLLLMTVPFAAMALYSEITMYLLLTCLILFGFATLAYCQSYIFRRVFSKYEPEAAEKSDADDTE